MSVSLSAGGRWSGREKYLTDAALPEYGQRTEQGWIAFYTIESGTASHSSGGLGNVPGRKGAGTIKAGRYEKQGVG